MRRYVILAAAVVMQICLGATYSWSVYVQPIREITGLFQGPVQLPFTMFYFAFPATMMFSGFFLPRLGTRKSAMIGGVLFGAGWLTAGLGHLQFSLTILGIGLLAGVGVGMAYIVPISVCIQWFPERKGLVTGVAVAGFGGGAALVSQIGGRMMHAGWSPFETFGIFGAAFFILVCLAGSVMVPPDPAAMKNRKPLPFKEVCGHPEFKILYLAMFAGLAAGFAVNANLKELFPGNDVKAGILAVSLFALANALGRMTWGYAFDRMASATAIQANLICQAVVLAAVPKAVDTPSGFLAVALLTGFNYGGVLVIYVSSGARIWGAERVGQVYGWLFSANIPAALSPIAAGMVYDRLGNFAPALWAIAALLAVAALVIRRRASAVNLETAPAGG